MSTPSRISLGFRRPSLVHKSHIFLARNIASHLLPPAYKGHHLRNQRSRKRSWWSRYGSDLATIGETKVNDISSSSLWDSEKGIWNAGEWTCPSSSSRISLRNDHCMTAFKPSLWNCVDVGYFANYFSRNVGQVSWSKDPISSFRRNYSIPSRTIRFLCRTRSHCSNEIATWTELVS